VPGYVLLLSAARACSPRSASPALVPPTGKPAATRAFTASTGPVPDQSAAHLARSPPATTTAPAFAMTDKTAGLFAPGTGEVAIAVTELAPSRRRHVLWSVDPLARSTTTSPYGPGGLAALCQQPGHALVAVCRPRPGGARRRGSRSPRWCCRGQRL